MDERRDLLISLGWHLLLAVPFLVIAWRLFSTSIGDPDGADKRLLGLGCVVTAGIIIARPLAGLMAEPTGSLFFPQQAARREPGYSIAEARRKKGNYPNAIVEYEKIAAAFPNELTPYIAIMQIAFGNLGDATRGDAAAQRGLAMLRDDASRAELLRVHRTLKAKLRSAAPAPTTEEDMATTPATTSEREEKG